MTTINDLPGVTTIDNSDLIPLYQKRNRRTRNIAIEELRDYIYVSVDGKYAPIEHVGSRGADQHAPVLAGGDAGFMSGSDKSKLDGIEEGAQVNVPANLSTTVGDSTVTVNSDTGTDATIPAATTTDAGVMTAADKTKLDGIQAGATQNQTDAFLLNRANHTGLQAASTISNFQTTVRDTGLLSLTIPAAAPITESDTVLQAFGKVQAQINATNTDLPANVRGTVLTGLSTADSTPVVATDTVLIGFGKLQAQMGAVASALDAINGVVI